MQNRDFRSRITSFSVSKDPTCGFYMQNSDSWTWITGLYVFHTWPVILCMYKSVLSIRITSLYGSQPSSVVFACKQRLLDQIYKFLWVPDFTCRFVHSNSAWLATRITSLYGFQPSFVVLRSQNSNLKAKIACVYWSQTALLIFCMQNSVPSIRITCLYAFQPSSVVFACKTGELCTRITNPYWSQTSPVILCTQNSVISIRITSLLWVPALFCGFCMQNSAILEQIYKSL